MGSDDKIKGVSGIKLPLENRGQEVREILCLSGHFNLLTFGSVFSTDSSVEVSVWVKKGLCYDTLFVFVEKVDLPCYGSEISDLIVHACVGNFLVNWLF